MTHKCLGVDVKGGLQVTHYDNCCITGAYLIITHYQVKFSFLFILLEWWRIVATGPYSYILVLSDKPMCGTKHMIQTFHYLKVLRKKLIPIFNFNSRRANVGCNYRYCSVKCFHKTITSFDYSCQNMLMIYFLNYLFICFRILHICTNIILVMLIEMLFISILLSLVPNDSIWAFISWV